MRSLVFLTTVLLLATFAAPAGAAVRLQTEALGADLELDSAPEARDLRPVQSGGMSLSQAVEMVRKRTGGKIVSAETRVQGGREVHHIKVLTKDGKVRTERVNGRRR